MLTVIRVSGVVRHFQDPKCQRSCLLFWLEHLLLIFIIVYVYLLPKAPIYTAYARSLPLFCSPKTTERRRRRCFVSRLSFEDRHAIKLCPPGPILSTYKCTCSSCFFLKHGSHWAMGFKSDSRDGWCGLRASWKQVVYKIQDIIIDVWKERKKSVHDRLVPKASPKWIMFLLSGESLSVQPEHHGFSWGVKSCCAASLRSRNYRGHYSMHFIDFSTRYNISISCDSAFVILQCSSQDLLLSKFHDKVIYGRSNLLVPGSSTKAVWCGMCVIPVVLYKPDKLKVMLRLIRFQKCLFNYETRAPWTSSPVIYASKKHDSHDSWIFFFFESPGVKSAWWC